MNTTYSLKQIGSLILPPNRPEYQNNLAESIQSIFKKQPSLIKIITLDVLSFANQKERLKAYRGTHQHAYRLFIQLAGNYFATSPNEKRTQLPLMILTNTKSIFLRRIKKLKNIQSKQIFNDSSSSQSSYKTFSQSSQNPSSSDYLISNISRKNLSSLLNSSKSMVSFTSQIDIFNVSYSLNQSSVNLNLRAIKQSIKQSAFRLKLLTGINDQEKQLIKSIKKTQQQQVGHLICNYEPAEGQISVNSKRQLEVNSHRSEKQSDKTKYLNKLSNIYEPNAQEQDLLMENLPLQIKQRLKKQLNRYKLSTGQLSVQSSGTNNSKKKVREKAEQMLKKLGLHSYHE